MRADAIGVPNAGSSAPVSVLGPRRGPLALSVDKFPVRGVQGCPGPRGAGIRCAAWPMASVVAGAASASSCFWFGFAIERQVEQHDALASLVDEVGPGLVLILSDSRHDYDGRSTDPAVAGQAGAAHSVLADRHGLDFLRVLSGNRTGVTERPSDYLMVEIPADGAGASLGRGGAGIRGAVGAVAQRWAWPPAEAAWMLCKLHQSRCAAL